MAPSSMNRQPWRFGVEGDELILKSAIHKKKHDVSPYLGCGIALLHLLIGAGVEDVEVNIRYEEPPVIATIYS